MMEGAQKMRLTKIWQEQKFLCTSAITFAVVGSCLPAVLLSAANNHAVKVIVALGCRTQLTLKTCCELSEAYPEWDTVSDVA